MIDDDKARDKVSQALRENAPTIRAEIETEINVQRAEQHMHQQPPHNPHYPPPPQNAPPNPYYAQQGWGHFSYYGYAQQAPAPPGSVAPPPGAMVPPPAGAMPPPPPTYQAHPMYPGNAPHFSNNSGGSPHSSQAPSPTPMMEAQQPPLQPMQPPPPQQQQQPQPPPQQPQQQSIFNFSFGSTTQQQQHQQQAEDDNDDQSIFGAMSTVFPSSLASWAKDAFSIGGGMSVASNRDDNNDNASVASKPIQYVHRPEDDNSVGSRARSVTFKDERSISGRALDLNKKHSKPPRIMHSSQMSFPRTPKRNTPAAGRPPVVAGSLNNPAPVSSVNLADHSEGMISVMTTDGMGSIMEDTPLTIGDFSHSSFGKSQLSAEVKAFAGAPAPGMVDHRRVKRHTYRSNSGIKPEDPNNSMLSAVANQIVMGGMGSLDIGALSSGQPADQPEAQPPADMEHETMAVEIEGQEVQLMDMMDSQLEISGKSGVVEDRMPPHSKEQGWPLRVGSGHSFFNDSLSLFSGNGNGGELSAASSMDMDVSSNTDPYSCAGSVGAGSIGGASLCRVFDADSVAPAGTTATAMPSPSARGSKQLPNWERTLRTRSPSSVGGEPDDAEEDSFSVMTKGSEKLMGGSICTMGSGEHNE